MLSVTKSTKVVRWLTGSALLVFAHGGAMAQTAASAGEGADQSGPTAQRQSAGQGEIIVTARRRDERNLDVPISVVAISGDALKDRGVVGLEDVPNAVAGIKIEPQNTRTSTPQVVIRGQRQYGLLEAQDPPTAFYFAEVPVAPNQGFSAALYDLASIQVLKGPQGTLFGRNTTGGALLIQPAKPTGVFEGSVTATAGSYETFGGTGYINAPLSDTLDVRLSGYYRKHGGYAKYVSTQLMGQEAYKENIFDTRLSVVWRPTSSIENYTVANISDIRGTVNPAIIVAYNPNSSLGAFDGTGDRAAFPTIESQVYIPGGSRGPREALSDFPQYDNVKTHAIVNNTTFELSENISLKNIASYRRMVSEGKFNVFGTSLPGIQSDSGASAKNYTEELQLNGNFLDDRLTITTGLFYSQLDAYIEGQTAAFYIAPPISPTRANAFVADISNISKAAYAQATFKITEKLSFTGGVRVTEDTRKVDYQSQNKGRLQDIPLLTTPYCYLLDDDGVRLSPDECSIPVKVKYTKPTYTLSLDYHITPDFMVYVTRRTGYRSGGFNQRAFTAAQRVPFKPETMLDHEVGFKGKFNLADWTIRAAADYYHDKYKNLQKAVLSDVNGVIASSIFNAAEGYVKGFEGEIDVSPSSSFTIGGNIAYTDTGYKSYPYLVNGVLEDFSDRTFSGIPKWQYSIYGSLDLPVDPQLGTISLVADMSYKSGTFVSDVYQSREQLAEKYTPEQAALLPEGDRPFKTRPYRLVNARLNWSNINSSAFSASVWARNLFNVAPEVSTSPSFEGSGITAVSIGPPRVVGLDVTFDF